MTEPWGNAGLVPGAPGYGAAPGPDPAPQPWNVLAASQT